jgi:hypothetical protein
LFHKRFILLVDHVLSPEERNAKRFRLWAYMEEITQEQMLQATQLERLIDRGIVVTQHLNTGDIRRAVLKYEKKDKDKC